MDCIITSYTRAYYYFAHRISDSPSPVNRPSAIATLPITFDDAIALCIGKDAIALVVEVENAIALWIGKNAIALLWKGRMRSRFVLEKMRFTWFVLFASHAVPEMNGDNFKYDEITIPKTHTYAESHNLFRR
ncbi:MULTISPECIES: hypothetical protein [Cyanophyceae]|uniref:hypothetical protein n=1 Tax=Cyanophyceae TaxID=3028117 RepID=UPI0016837C07|nr:hypothetical protein [Trichocoleus sp. FACHB-69]MBD1935385.1 hypothetical protein [Trichocoleus sp. FACHB-69]